MFTLLRYLLIAFLTLTLTACASPIPTLVLFPSPTPSVTPIPTPTLSPAPSATRIHNTHAPPPTSTPAFASTCQAKRLFYEYSDSENGVRGIAVACIDGSEVLFTESVYEGDVREFAVSSQGTLAISTYNDGVYLQRYPSRAYEKLTSISEVFIKGMSWSPDGEYLAYVSSSAGRPLMLLEIMHVDSQTVSEMISIDDIPDLGSFGDSYTLWSPHQNQIGITLVGESLQVATVACNSTSHTCTNESLTELPLILDGYYLRPYTMSWLPDGTGVLVPCTPDVNSWVSNFCGINLNGQLVTEIDGKALGLQEVWAGTWAPNGMLFAFAGYLADGADGRIEVFIYSIEDDSLDRITFTPELSEFSPQWQPTP